MNYFNNNRIYCVLDMPLAVIEAFLCTMKQSKQDLLQFVTHITPVALRCLHRVSQMPALQQQKVIKGELPLHRIAEQVSNRARLHHSIK